MKRTLSDTDNERPMLGRRGLNGSASQALQNELVLEKIVKFIPATDLLAVRATSVNWNHTLLPDMRSKHIPVQLKSHNIEEIERILYSSKEIPFASYRIDYFAHNFSVYLKFFSVFGQSVQRLRITASLSDKQEDRQAVLLAIRDILFNLVPDLEELDLNFEVHRETRWGHSKQPMATNLDTDFAGPTAEEPKQKLPMKQLLKLKRLIFHSGYEIKKSASEVEELFIDLLKSSVGLEKLEFNSAWSDIRALYSSQALDKLKSLTVLDPAFDDLKILTELSQRDGLKLKLRQLELDLEYCGPELAQLLFDFLATHASQLLDFKFHSRASAGYTPGNVLSIPVMAKLHTLNLYGSGAAIDVRYEAGSFSDNFPSLKKLILDDMGVYEPNSCRPAGVPQRCWWEDIAHPGVTHLVSKQIICAPWMRAYGVVLSSVSRIEFTMNRYTMDTLGNAFWTIWPNLQALQIHYYSPHKKHRHGEVDEFISGVRKVWELDGELSTSPPLNLDTIRLLLFKYKTEPGISDLKHLQKFVLDIHCNAGLELTDIGGLFGIAMAGPMLQHFEVNRIAYTVGHSDSQPAVLMSTTARAFIRDALGPLAYINIC